MKGKVNPVSLPVVRRVENPAWLPVFQLKNVLPPNTETWRCGVLYILLMKPAGEWQHRITVASQFRYPELFELMHVWNSLVPDAAKKPAVIMLPSQAAYEDPRNFALTIQELSPEQVGNNAV